MPIYEYRCESCDHELEALVRGGREPETCPSCEEGKLSRKISRAGVIFKGSGFYVTDSRGGNGSGKSKSNGSSDSSSKSSGSGESSSGGESKSTTESKPKEAKSSSGDSGGSSKAAS